MSHSDVSCRGFLKSTSIIAIAAGAFASASVLLAKVAASSVAIMGCQNTDTRQLIREPFQLFDYVPERSQVIRDSKLEEETTPLVEVEDTNYAHFKNGVEAMVASDPRMCNNPADLRVAAGVTVILGTHSYHEGKIFHFGPGTLTIQNGDSSLVKSGEARWALRQKPNGLAGWTAGHHSSVLDEAGHMRLAGPWIDGKESQVYR